MNYIYIWIIPEGDFTNFVDSNKDNTLQMLIDFKKTLTKAQTVKDKWRDLHEINFFTIHILPVNAIEASQSKMLDVVFEMKCFNTNQYLVQIRTIIFYFNDFFLEYIERL